MKCGNLAAIGARAVVTTIGVDALQHPCHELLSGIHQRNHQLLQPVFVYRAELKTLVVPLDDSSKRRTRVPPHHDVVGGRLQPLPPCRLQCPLYGRTYHNPLVYRPPHLVEHRFGPVDRFAHHALDGPVGPRAVSH